MTSWGGVAWSKAGRLASAARSHEGLRRYASNTSWMVGEQVIRLGLGFLVGIWVVRYLGPTSFGILAYAGAVAGIFAGMAKLGMDGMVVRELVRAPERAATCLGTAFWLKVGGATLALAVIGAFVLLAPNERPTKLYVLIIGAATLFDAFEVVGFYFQARTNARPVSVSKLVQVTLSSLLKVALILGRAELFWFVIVVLVDQVTLAASYLVSWRLKGIGPFPLSFDQATALRLLRDSWPLLFSSVFVMIYMRIDQVMIKEMLGAKYVGLYSATTRISELWYFIPVVVSNSVFPAIVRGRELGERLYKLRLQRLLTALVWMAIANALVMTFLGEWAIILLFGRAYQGCGQVLMVQAWTGVFVSMGVAGNTWFTAENLQLFSFYRTFLGAVINVLLNLVLIPRLGLLGAALATLAAQAVASWGADAVSRKTRPMFAMKLSTLYFADVFDRADPGKGRAAPP